MHPLSPPAPKWVNTEGDAGALPVLLERMATLLPPETLDTIWIFPTRRATSLESTVIVAAVLTDDPERRRVFTAHFTVTRDRKGNATVEQRLHEQAIAPADALARVVDGVVRRLGEETARPPRTIELSGELGRWAALHAELGGGSRTPETTPGPARADPAASG